MATATAPEIRLVDLEKRFGAVRAVDGVSIDIASGEFFSLLGPSGCGKTTTLRMIGGFELPTAGRILLRDRDITMDPPDKRPVNMVFQSYALFPHLDVGGNVAFGLKRQHVEKAEITRRVGEALELVHLAGYQGRKPHQLSGGQQQRVALARALVNRPTVLLLDEPLGALDLKLRRSLQLELKRIQVEVGITFVYVTHDQEEALTMSDRIAIMNQGKVEQLGTPEELYERPTTRFVADFIGTTNLLRGTVDAGGAVRLSTGELAPCSVGALAAGSEVELSVRPESISLVPAEAIRRDPRQHRAGRLSREHRVLSSADQRRARRVGPGPQDRDPTPGRQRCRHHLARRGRARPRRPIGPSAGGDRMTARTRRVEHRPRTRPGSAYLRERRIIAPPAPRADGAFGAAAALAPIIAACTSGSRLRDPGTGLGERRGRRHRRRPPPRPDRLARSPRRSPVPGEPSCSSTTGTPTSARARSRPSRRSTRASRSRSTSSLDHRPVREDPQRRQGRRLRPSLPTRSTSRRSSRRAPSRRSTSR